MSESLRSGGGEDSVAKRWEDLAEQIASHSTVDGHGDTVYLGREVHESERAKVEESGFERPGESPRGSKEDRDISEDVYPQLEGESDDDYMARLENMREEAWRDVEGDAVTDARKAYNNARADFRQRRASADDLVRAEGETIRAKEDRDYYRGVPEEEALGIAKQFGNVESKDSKHLEPVRGDHNDIVPRGGTFEDVYPRLEGESDDDYKARLRKMRDASRY